MIGILPCAGNAERFHRLPKYLLPIPPDSYLLAFHCDLMESAGCERALVGTNPDNYLQIEQLRPFGIRQSFHAEHFETMTQTVLSGYHLMNVWGIESERVLFGMPDTYFTDTTAYQQLTAVDADVVVGCFRIPPNEQHKHDLVRVEHGQVVEVLNKPALQSNLQCTWGILLWKPIFWQYLRPEDPHVGHGLPRAIADGLDVRAVVIEGGYWNIGTNADYFDLIRAIEWTEV